LRAFQITRRAAVGLREDRTSQNPQTPPSRAKLIAAFAALYIIWGSTYLAIRFAIETIPPFLMAGIRFTIAGVLLFAWSRMRGATAPERRHWVSCAVVGLLLLVGGNGAVVWAEQTVPSGLVALLIAIVPCWMVLIEWLRPGGVRPTGRIIAGLVLGLIGLVMLIGPAAVLGGGGVDPVGAIVVALGSLSWAAGSIYARQANMPKRPRLATGMQMIAGGAGLLIVGVVAGEVPRLHVEAVSLRSALALVYLILFGAIVAYSAYIWLLQVSTPARVSTYAYVNPVVAVILGWALAGEELSGRMLMAAVVIVAGVAMITLGGRRPEEEPGCRPTVA
jgi:drug/metabolite transporter (DMT)-like permease